METEREPQKILFVSHCLLNTAAKVVGYGGSGEQEELARRDLLQKALDLGVQLVQLPCPEFTLYGPNRWGHMSDQFDNPFFRAHCRELLRPVLVQMLAYHQAGERRFRLLGVLGINGSPSCGVDFTCSGDWGGEFSGRQDLPQALASAHRAPRPGIFFQELMALLEEHRLPLPVVGLDPREPQAAYRLVGAQLP